MILSHRHTATRTHIFLVQLTYALKEARYIKHYMGTLKKKQQQSQIKPQVDSIYDLHKP